MSVHPHSARDASRDYLRRGWAPIPVPYRSKNPNRVGWQDLRLTEHDLAVYFDGRPQNVGLLLGAPSGDLVDVDLDAPEARVLADAFLPSTPCVFGRPTAARAHRFFVPDTALSTRKFRDPTAKPGDERAMLVELRTTGTQTLVPPSVHPSGEQIAWDMEGEPTSVSSVELMPAVARLAAASLLARHWPAPGHRHEAALALAGGLLHAGWSAGESANFVAAVAFATGDEEMDDRTRSTESTRRAMAGDRRTTGWPTLTRLLDPRLVDIIRDWLGIRLPHEGAGPNGSAPDAPWVAPTPLPEGERPDFPTDALPPIFRAFVFALAWATQTPAVLAALLCLAVLAAAAAKGVVVLARAGWREPVNLFVAVALGPANRKSAVFAECAKPLEVFEAAEAARQAPEIAAKHSVLKIQRKELEALERKAASTDASVSAKNKASARERAAALAREIATAEVAEPPRFVVDDCSPEKLANLLATQGGRIAALSAEGGIFGMMAGRYAKNGEPNLDVYLKGHAGDTLRVDRVGRPPDHVPAPALTIGLAVQPAVLRRLADRPEFRERGIPARFLFGVPTSFVGRRVIGPPAVPADVRDTYRAAILATLELPRFVDKGGNPHPQELVLDAGADAALRAFERRLEPRLGAGGDLEHVADWAGKLAGAVCRLAGLLHLVEHAAGKAPWDIPIAKATMAVAVRIAEEFLVPHALTAFAVMGADPALDHARRLLAWIDRSKKTTFSIRDAHQDLRKHQLSVSMVERAAALLVEHGYLRPVPPLEPETEQPKTGRPPTPRFAVNPLWRPQNPHNPQSPKESTDCEVSEEFEDDTAPNDQRADGWEEVVF
ncbi:MAG: DUF3987 domain-containing protein [Thermomicrobiales bacterium]